MLDTHQCATLVEASQIAYWQWEAASDLISGPAKLFSLFDLPPMPHCPLERMTDKVRPQDRALIYQMFYQAQQGEPRVEVSFRVQQHSGRILHLEVVGFAQFNEQQQLVKIEGSVQNISRFHKAELLPEFQRHHDILTDLLNREGFMAAGEAFLTQTQHPHAALLVFDIDRFQKINESLGIEAGDSLLTLLAQRLKQIVREHDIIARLSADEFAVLIKQVKSEKELSMLINRYWQALKAPFVLNQTPISLNFSLGIARYPDEGKNLQQLLQAANSARNAVKQQGGNGFQFYQPSFNSTAHQQLQLEIELQQALKHQEIQVLFQPQVHAHTEQLYGAEALVRWQHPKLGQVSPEQFIPLAESNGLILELGRYIIQQAIAQAVQWWQQGHPIHIGINLSPRQFNDPALLDFMSQQPHFSDVAPYLDIEITETTAMRDIEQSLHLLEQFKAHQLALAIDDFGTGYSSLAYLQAFPIDALKIDRAFVLNLDNATGQSLCRAIIQLGKSLNLQIIAEGVETETQAHFLRQEGCDIFQGYLFGKAMTAQQLEKAFKIDNDKF